MKPTVVLLHGLARTQRSLAGLRRHIAAAGYPTWAWTYPSRRMPVDELAATVAARIRADLGGAPLFAVTHSLGGILVRHMATQLPWQRVVMLAPPNAGSQVAARLHDNPIFRWYFGPAATDVANASDAWPPPPRPFAVIAGTVGPSVGNVPSWLTSGLKLLPPDVAHDGTVTVEETRLEGMADFAAVPASHTWIMNHPDTRRMVLSFLDHGRLDTREARVE